MIKMPRVLVCLSIAALSFAASAHAQNWAAFRGPHASGVATGAPSVSWDAAAKRNVAWKTPIPGLAHSSPIVWGDRVYVTTAVASTGRPTVRTGDSSRAGIGAAPDMVSHTWHVLALDKKTGAIAWNREAH